LKHDFPFFLILVILESKKILNMILPEKISPELHVLGDEL